MDEQNLLRDALVFALARATAPERTLIDTESAIWIGKLAEMVTSLEEKVEDNEAIDPEYVDQLKQDLEYYQNQATTWESKYYKILHELSDLKATLPPVDYNKLYTHSGKAIKELLRDKVFIDAIKRIRMRFGMGLKEAKDIVDNWRLELGIDATDLHPYHLNGDLAAILKTLKDEA